MPGYGGKLLLAVSIATLATSSARALEWDADTSTSGAQGGSGLWNDGNRWWNGTQNVPWGTGGTAVFGGTPGTVNIDGMNLGSLTFHSPYTLTSAQYYQYLSGSSPVIAVTNEGSGATIQANMVAWNGLIKDGPGTLIVTPVTAALSLVE